MNNTYFSLSIISLAIILVLIGTWFIYEQTTPFAQHETYDWNIEGFNEAKYFVDNGYLEIKSLSTQLLTLLSSLLVFSITFSDKIVRLNVGNKIASIILYVGWTYFILAIIADGIGLAFNAYTLPVALVDNHHINHDGSYSAEFYEYFNKSMFAIILSGYLFILGLMCLLLAGIISHLNKRVEVN